MFGMTGCTIIVCLAQCLSSTDATLSIAISLSTVVTAALGTVGYLMLQEGKCIGEGILQLQSKLTSGILYCSLQELSSMLYCKVGIQMQTALLCPLVATD